jgi:hypothetical protein
VLEEHDAKTSQTQEYHDDDDDDDLRVAMEISKHESQEKEVDTKKYSATVEELHQLFKSIEKKVIETVLEESGGDQEKAVDALIAMAN